MNDNDYRQVVILALISIAILIVVFGWVVSDELDKIHQAIGAQP